MTRHENTDEKADRPQGGDKSSATSCGSAGLRVGGRSTQSTIAML